MDAYHYKHSFPFVSNARLNRQLLFYYCDGYKLPLLKLKKKSQAVLPYFKKSFQSTPAYGDWDFTNKHGMVTSLGQERREIMGSVLPINLNKNMAQGPAQAVPTLNL